MRRIDKNNDGSVDLIEWWKQFHENACSGPAGAAGGIAGASWHIDAPKKEARGVRGLGGAAGDGGVLPSAPYGLRKDPTESPQPRLLSLCKHA